MGEDIIMEDLTPAKPICTCKKCLVQSKIDSLLEVPCTCTYRIEIKNETYTDIDGVEKTHSYAVQVIDIMCERCKTILDSRNTLEKYSILENANIDEHLWDNCNIIDSVIYTPTAETCVSEIQKLWDSVGYLVKADIVESAT